MGRTTMVVDFKKLLRNNDESQNILLRDEDSIWVPRARGYVNVTGSVNNQGNVGYVEGYTFEDYIKRAGGYTGSADRDAVRVINSRTSSYIDPADDRSYQIGPGDTIVVPNERPQFWKNFGLVTAVVAQVLTIVAGVLLLFPRN
jgi:polysaccharide biosynthesis/export protein